MTYMDAARLGRFCVCADIKGGAAVLYPAYWCRAYALRGPDDFRWERPHLLEGLEVQVIIQAYFPTVRPVLSSRVRHLLKSLSCPS